MSGKHSLTLAPAIFDLLKGFCFCFITFSKILFFLLVRLCLDRVPAWLDYNQQVGWGTCLGSARLQSLPQPWKRVFNVACDASCWRSGFDTAWWRWSRARVAEDATNCMQEGGWLALTEVLRLKVNITANSWNYKNDMTFTKWYIYQCFLWGTKQKQARALLQESEWAILAILLLVK